jgi:2-polyprenyl-3-methyl-5-hydroxy-6-metoxy-1,4-benzoquinol methylase
MTIWDNIYKNYQKGGEAWATLSEEINPLFKEFLTNSNFDQKHILDIGCGTGKYLKFMQAEGFHTDGIDSSETAVEMTQKTLGEDSTILCVNMFEFEIPKNKYDLVISVSTIHHGTKDQIQNLINKIFDVITENGKIFITVPDFESSKKWNTFKDHEEITEGTFAPLSGPEKGLPHSFFTKEEVQKLFSKFREVKLNLDEIGRWTAMGSK